MRSSYLIALFTIISSTSHAIQPLELNAGFTRDMSRSYDGIENFAFERLETRLTTPVVEKSSYVGSWIFGADFTESRLLLSGLSTATRRLYRFSVPMQFFPRRVGRFQHEWMFEPAYYSDESITSQKRYTLEYAWQLRYHKSNKMSFVAGIARDNRFGSAKMHPIFGLESKPNKRIFHHWVFPNIFTDIRLNKKMAVRGFLQANGGNWQYLQPDESVAIFSISEWKLGLSLRLDTKMPFDIVGQAGMRMMGTGAAAGTSGDYDDSFFFGIGINTPFDTNIKPRSRRR